MKIVTREQFMKYPAETLYSTYEPCYFGPLLIKGDTIEHDGKNIDWFYQQIADAVDAENSGALYDTLVGAEKLGFSVALDFDCQGRDGLFDDKQLYAVWEPQDVIALVSRLQACLPPTPEDKL